MPCHFARMSYVARLSVLVADEACSMLPDCVSNLVVVSTIRSVDARDKFSASSVEKATSDSFLDSYDKFIPLYVITAPDVYFLSVTYPEIFDSV